MLTGTVLQVVPGRRLVMAWRLVKWTSDDPDSTLILNFLPAGERGRIDLIHVDVPGHDFEDVKRGWKKYYWDPWMAWLEKR